MPCYSKDHWVAVDEDHIRPSTAAPEEDWEHDISPARKATPRDILRLHLRLREVPACASKLNEHSPRAEQTEDLPSRNAE